MTYVESMDYTHSRPSIIASLFGTVHCPFSPWSWCNLRRCIQTPWYDTLCHTQTSLYLPQNSHHTYLLWHFHSHSEIYCHATFPPFRSSSWHTPSLSYCLAWSCSWHRICGKATDHNSSIHVTHESLHIPVHRRRHSYRVISCSKYRVVILEL